MSVCAVSESARGCTSLWRPYSARRAFVGDRLSANTASARCRFTRHADPLLSLPSDPALPPDTAREMLDGRSITATRDGGESVDNLPVPYERLLLSESRHDDSQNKY